MTITERESAIRCIRERISAFRDEQFGPFVTEVFEDERRNYPPPAISPSRVPHPRLMLTREMLPKIKEAFQNPECIHAVDEYRSLLLDPSDAILPPAYLHESGRSGDHNFDYRVLAMIEARALEYLLSGEKYYGYRAILNMLNFLTTLDIKWISSDQCREFGITMYTTALVYDWCYDLLTDDEKRRFTLGVEHILCRGVTEDTVHSTYGGIKMEVGFPPTRNGSVSGHGSEMQILRDYLAYSIAAYDEYPGWWNYVGARVENEYIPVRREFYKAGMYPQGMSCYAPHRYISDLWSAWMLKIIYGENPYSDSDMARVARSMLANETVDGNMFASGDGSRASLSAIMSPTLVMSSYLFNDPTARAAAFHLKAGVVEFPYGYIHITPTISIIASTNGITKAEERHEGLPYLLENKGYLNQYILRNGWTGDAAVILMKAGGRSTANHDHCNAGSFQIWHKGYLTGDVGLYSGYGSVQHSMFHVASIAHNALLVYNPSHHDDELIVDENGRETNRARYWYSGGQRRTGEAQCLAEWQTDTYLTGGDLVMQSDGGEKPSYAYISTDITPAYEKDTVAFAERVMLACYTENQSAPLAFFVRDRITSTDPSFRKTFLLQIPGEEAPILDGKRATIFRDGGSLTITSLSDAKLEALGGKGRNFLVNGVQCAPPNGRDSGQNWGRIEISTEGSMLLNVITVGDRGDTAPIAYALTCDDGLVGASVSGVAAIFRATEGASDKPLGFTLGEASKTFLCGLTPGSWVVSNDGAEIASGVVSSGEDMLVLDLPSGSFNVTRK